MIFVTNFLLSACNMEFSNTLTRNLTSNISFLFVQLPVYKNVICLDNSTVTIYFCIFVIFIYQVRVVASYHLADVCMCVASLIFTLYVI